MRGGRTPRPSPNDKPTAAGNDRRAGAFARGCRPAPCADPLPRTPPVATMTGGPSPAIPACQPIPAGGDRRGRRPRPPPGDRPAPCAGAPLPRSGGRPETTTAGASVEVAGRYTLPGRSRSWRNGQVWEAVRPILHSAGSRSSPGVSTRVSPKHSRPRPSLERYRKRMRSASLLWFLPARAQWTPKRRIVCSPRCSCKRAVFAAGCFAPPDGLAALRPAVLARGLPASRLTSGMSALPSRWT